MVTNTKDVAPLISNEMVGLALDFGFTVETVSVDETHDTNGVLEL